MYRGWTQTDCQNKHYNINQKDEETWEDRGRDGGTNFILRIKEQETRLTLQEHDDDDDDKHEKTQLLPNRKHVSLHHKDQPINSVWEHNGSCERRSEGTDTRHAVNVEL